jgi:CBS domain-containing protein
MTSLVRDVMTTKVVTVEPWTPFREIVTRLAEHRISAAPVLDPAGNLLGIVTEADLLLKQEHPDLELNVPLAWSRRRRLERDKAAAIVAGKLMTTPAITVAPTATITEAARRMHTAGVKRLPVVDEAGRLVGIVSRADLLKVFIRTDEAIWREIMDDVIAGDFMMDPSRSSSTSSTVWSSCRAGLNGAGSSRSWSGPSMAWRAWSGSRTGSPSTSTTTTSGCR